MKKVYFELESLDKIHEAARYFLNAVGDANIFAIDGDMGVGKTTFIKAVCEELGVKDVITSPTFSLVNEYTDGKGEPVYHFDFYRIKKIAEVFDIGVEQYFDSGHYCFIEWPDIVEFFLPDEAVHLEIYEQEDGTRRFIIKWYFVD